MQDSLLEGSGHPGGPGGSTLNSEALEAELPEYSIWTLEGSSRILSFRIVDTIWTFQRVEVWAFSLHTLDGGELGGYRMFSLTCWYAWKLPDTLSRVAIVPPNRSSPGG